MEDAQTENYSMGRLVFAEDHRAELSNKRALGEIFFVLITKGCLVFAEDPRAEVRNIGCLVFVRGHLSDLITKSVLRAC